MHKTLSQLLRQRWLLSLLLNLNAAGLKIKQANTNIMAKYKHENEIAKGLTRKLLTYALGRRIGFSDRDDVQNIANDVSKKNYGLRALVHAIVQSDIFARP